MFYVGISFACFFVFFRSLWSIKVYKMIQFYTVEEFAKILKVCKHTVLKDIKSGRINALRSSGGKNSPFRIPVTELERLMVMSREQ